MSVCVNVKYNPFTASTEIRVDGELPEEHTNLSNFISDRDGQPVFDWFGKFLEQLYKVRRNGDIRLSFSGTADDCLSFQSTVKAISEVHKRDWTVTVESAKTELPNPLEKLNQIYAKACEEDSPVRDVFTDASVRKVYEKAIDRDFEVSVFASVSSGKSTLLNAMLGQRIMPTMMTACTAKITRIIDCDKMRGKPFSACLYDKDDKRMDIKPLPVTYEKMKEWNGDNAISRVVITGDIPTVRESPSARYVLQDTPGPNNARDPLHRQITLDEINKPLSMVLYVVKPSSFESTDNDWLFNKVRTALFKSDEMARNRFVFVLNMMDDVDLDDESLMSVYEKFYDSLVNPVDKSVPRILNPVVIPVSAKAAYLIRMHRYNPEYFEANKDAKRQYEKFVEKFAEDKWNMFSICKSKFSIPFAQAYEKRLLSASKDEEERALLHTGVPILEAFLQDFLYRHALPSKVREALKSFQSVFESADRAAALKKILEQGNQLIDEFASELADKKKQEERLEKGRQFKEKLKLLEFELTPEVKDELEKLSTESEVTIKEIKKSFGEGSVLKSKADSRCKQAEVKCDVLVDKIKGQFDECFKSEQKNKVDELINEYNKYLEKEFGKIESPDVKKFKSSMLTIKADDIMGAANVERRVVYGRHWYTLWCWKHEDSIEEYVDMKEIAADFDVKMLKARRAAVQEFQEQCENLFKDIKRVVLQKITRLDENLEKVVDAISNAAKGTEEKERELKQVQQQIEWCNEMGRELRMLNHRG